MSEESEIVEPVEEAKKRGVFKIVDVVKERGYPKTTVDIYLDEAAAFMAADIDARVREVQNEMDKKALSPAELKKLNAKHEEFVAKRDEIIGSMSDQKYVFHITGIPEGKREVIYNKSYERYPAKHEVDRNPLTGEVTRKETESPERLKYFTTLLWEAHIEKIVSPEGDEQVGITAEEASELRQNLPLASISKITDAIDKIRASTALFMLSVNEDFLAKS